MQEGPDPGEVLVSRGLAGVAELINDLLHSNRIPHDSGIAEQAEATGLIHDFVEIPIPKLAPVRKEQPAGQRMPGLATVELQTARRIFSSWM